MLFARCGFRPLGERQESQRPQVSHDPFQAMRKGNGAEECKQKPNIRSTEHDGRAKRRQHEHGSWPLRRCEHDGQLIENNLTLATTIPILLRMTLQHDLSVIQQTFINYLLLITRDGRAYAVLVGYDLRQEADFWCLIWRAHGKV